MTDLDGQYLAVSGSGNVPPFLLTVVDDITAWLREEVKLLGSLA